MATPRRFRRSARLLLKRLQPRPAPPALTTAWLPREAERLYRADLWASSALTGQMLQMGSWREPPPPPQE